MEAFQKGFALGLGERGERPLERPVAAREPRPHLRRGERVQVDDRPAPVVRVLAAAHEAVILELAGELARGGQGELQLARELTDRPLALGADVGQDGHVPPREPRLARHECEQLVGRPPPLPEAAHHPAQVVPKRVQLPALRYHCASVII